MGSKWDYIIIVIPIYYYIYLVLDNIKLMVYCGKKSNKSWVKLERFEDYYRYIKYISIDYSNS